MRCSSPPLDEVRTLPLAPRNPLPYLTQLRCAHSFIDGFGELLAAGGPVTRVVFGPRWLMPPAVVIASPQGAR
ncbi:MAG TPA: cytochrome P450, partial [Mycobacterium sp.]|nr:cytochrome P450 [Mycobacterium sp.]